jgi:hypothetical protein
LVLLIRRAARLVRQAARLNRVSRPGSGWPAARRAVVTGQRDGFLGHPDVVRGQEHRVPLSVVSEPSLHGPPRWLAW